MKLFVRAAGCVRKVAPALALVFVLAGWGGVPVAQGQSDAGDRPSALAMLRTMTDFLATQDSVSFRIKTLFEIFDRGRKLQFGGGADIEIRRPDKLAMNYRDDLSEKRLWYDGTQLTLYDPLARAYSSMAAPPNIDAALDYFERQFGLVLPMTDLLGVDAYSLIESRARGISYVGLNEVDGEKCHHLSFVGDDADLQLWIRDGDQPVPCKFIVDYKDEPGRPEYIVVTKDWKFGKRLRDSRFEASIPEGTAKIEFIEIEEARR